MAYQNQQKQDGTAHLERKNVDDENANFQVSMAFNRFWLLFFVVSRSKYDLLPTNGQITPLGGIAKLILQSVLEKRNKTTAPG